MRELALSSISEGQPMVALEAAAVGLPIVSTDVGSCREIIEGFEVDPVKGRGGIVVEPCNPKAIAEALATIFLDDTLRQQMGEVLRRRVGSYYHKNRITRLYEELYDELIAATCSSHRQSKHHAGADHQNEQRDNCDERLPRVVRQGPPPSLFADRRRRLSFSSASTRSRNSR